MIIKFGFVERRKKRNEKIDNGAEAWDYLTKDENGSGDGLYGSSYFIRRPSVETKLALLERYLGIEYKRGAKWSIVKAKKRKK
jgi:hypothetical protein